MEQLIKAQGRRGEEGNATGYELLLQGWRDEIAVFHSHKQAEQLSDTEDEGAPAEGESVADVAVEEIDNHVVDGSHRHGDACSNKAERVVEPPDRESEEDIVCHFEHEEGDAVTFGKDAVAHGKRDATQEGIEDGHRCHAFHHGKFLDIEQAENIGHQHDKQDILISIIISSFFFLQNFSNAFL